VEVNLQVHKVEIRGHYLQFHLHPPERKDPSKVNRNFDGIKYTGKKVPYNIILSSIPELLVTNITISDSVPTVNFLAVVKIILVNVR